MRHTLRSWLLLGVVAVSIAEPATYSVGDINQYTRSVVSSLTMICLVI